MQQLETRWDSLRRREWGQHVLPEEVPTASIPLPPVRAPFPGTVPVTAAKPTETAVESPAPETIQARIRHDERSDRAGRPSPLKASMPTAAGGSHGRIQRTGLGAGQIGIRAVGRSVPRPSPRAWNIRRDLHAGDEQYQARHRGL